MKKNRGFRSFMFVVLSFALVLLVGQLVYSQDKSEPPKNEIAQEALELYIDNFVTEENFGNYGFEDYKEAQAAQVAAPYPVSFIGLEDLKGYESGAGAMKMLQEVGIYWYPVTANGETRTKLEMVKVDGAWIPGEFGGTATVQATMGAQSALERFLKAEGLEVEEEGVMLVKIPILNAAFLYFQSSDREYFVPALVQAERYDLE